jgi:Rieske Fe-S protein
MQSEKSEGPAPQEAGAGPTRRRLIGFILGGGLIASAISFLYPLFRYLLPPPSADLGSDTVVAGKVGELKPNSGKIFAFGSRPALLVLTVEGEYRALSATCTHLNCTVQYRPDLQEVWCACHNGLYDLNGRNISGPPPRPLQQYEVHVRGDEIIVSQSRGA